MQDWLKTFHGANQAFPAVEIAVKAAIALAIGLLVGFEREWSNKDIGVRTFAMTALLGLLGSLLGPVPLLLAGPFRSSTGRLCQSPWAQRSA